MSKFDLLIYFMKIFFINIYTYYIFIKVLNTNSIKRVIVVGTSLILSLICTITKYYTDSMISIFILYCLYSSFIEQIIKNKMGHSMLLTLICFTMSLTFWGISTTVSFVPYKMFSIENKFISLFLIVIIQGLLIYGFFKIKRFKNGFGFLKNYNKNRYVDLIIINVGIIIIFAYCLLGNNHYKLIRNLYIIFTILGVFMMFMIQKTLVFYYKQRLLEQTIEDYKNEIKEKDETIKKLSDEKFNISKLNHEFYNRQKALELKVKEMTLEAGEEISVLDRINNLTKEYSEDLQKIKGKLKLPLTDIAEIDDMFKYMQTECSKYNIDFKLQVEGNIYYLINNIIPKNKLETLIGDHIKDAIIAINSSNNKYKSILAILGIKEDCYEFCVYDTGIEFEIDTLLKLGTERITTHKEDGRKRNRIYDYI